MHRKLTAAYWVGKAAVKLHYGRKLDIYALCSEHEPERYIRTQRKAKIPTGIRWAVWRRDKFTCVYCYAWGNQLSLDHVVPEKYGGKADLDNLVTACTSCNNKKADRSYEKFIESEWLKKKKTKHLRILTTQGLTPPTVPTPGKLPSGKATGTSS